METESKVDYLPLVRGLIKMSSALNEYDVIAESKYFKFDFKRKSKLWVDIYEKISAPFLGSFVKEKEEALREAYIRFVETSDGINIKDEYRTALIVFYCKLRSSLNDIEELIEKGKASYVTYTLKNSTKDVLKAIEGQYRDIFNVRDVEGNSIDALSKQYDTLGKTMFVKK